MSTILMTFSIDRALDMAVRHDFFRQASVFEKGLLSFENLQTFKFDI